MENLEQYRKRIWRESKEAGFTEAQTRLLVEAFEEITRLKRRATRAEARLDALNPDSS